MGEHSKASSPRQRRVSTESSGKTTKNRAQRILSEGLPSITQDISHAVVIKEGNLFFLAEPGGDVPLGGQHGFGLYYNDCRFLHGYELRVAGVKPTLLVSTATHAFMAAFQLTNPELMLPDGTLLGREDLGIKWERVMQADPPALHDHVSFRNFAFHPVAFSVTLTFEAGFEDIFSVRELVSDQRGTLKKPVWDKQSVFFLYEGGDHRWRSVTAHFGTLPSRHEGTSATFELTIAPGESREITVSLLVEEADQRPTRGRPSPPPDFPRIESRLEQEADAWLSRETRIDSDSLVLNKIMARSLLDLRSLRSRLDGHSFFAAGVPWYVALFGRDSLMTALQTVAFDASIAKETLRVLALHQGTRVDPWRDEQPGKILHELRVGEKARLGEIPHTPYYGSIDATLLFLILFDRYADWTGDLSVFQELQPNIERALEWMRAYGDQDGDGLLEYKASSEQGLANQGWKDSGDAIVHADGTVASPPIRLVEVQAYAYRALLNMSRLYQRIGDTERASQLEAQAQGVKDLLNRRFWIDELQYYAMALQGDGQPTAVISSNAGHVLWTEAVDAVRAKALVERMMAEDMFSGWGIRTLSARERAYNPMAYHRGTIWPHDNAIIAAGFRRYGFDRAATRVFAGLVEACMHFEDYQLPELFCGFSRTDYGIPVRYPVACHPQAWAAGAIPFLLENQLGLTPDAFSHRLRVVRPVLPDFISRLDMHGLQVGEAKVDLRFERTADRALRVSVLKLDGYLEVTAE